MLAFICGSYVGVSYLAMFNMCDPLKKDNTYGKVMFALAPITLPLNLLGLVVFG